MWIWFNDKGILKQQITHDSYARVGSTTFKIFAYFDGIDIEENYTSATIRFQRPDLKKSEYPLLYMKKVSIPFELTDIDGNPDDILFKESEGPYKGYLFDFGNFTQEEDNIVLLDTPGRWEATITLYNSSNRNVVGLITFNVQASVSEVDDDPVELDISTITGNAALELASKVDKEALYYTRTKENFEENANNLSKQIYVADSYVFDPVSSVLYYIDSVTDNDEDTVTATYHVVTDLLTEAEINTILNNYYTKSQVNTLLNNYYTKSQVDNKLGQKVDCRFIEENDTIQNIIDDFGREDQFACYLKVEGDDNGNTVYNYYTIGVTPRSATNSQVEIEDPFSKTRWFALNISNETTFANIIRNSAYLQPYLVSSDLTNYYTKTETNSLLGSKQNTLVSGTNIKTINGQSILGSGNVDVQGLPSSTKYGASLELSINSSTYVITAQLKDQDGNNLGAAQTIDLPLESVVVGGSYDDTTKKVILTLQNGNTIEFSVADLVSGLQTEITSNNKLSADLVDDTNTVHKFVSGNEMQVYVVSQADIAGVVDNVYTFTNAFKNIVTSGKYVLKINGAFLDPLDTNDYLYYPQESSSDFYSYSTGEVSGTVYSIKFSIDGNTGDLFFVLNDDAGSYDFLPDDMYYTAGLVYDSQNKKISGYEGSYYTQSDFTLVYANTINGTAVLGGSSSSEMNNSLVAELSTLPTASATSADIVRLANGEIYVKVHVSNTYSYVNLATVSDLLTKQDTLVSGTNIKTINGESLLGSSNIVITGAGTIDPTLSASSTNAIQNRAVAMALNGKIVYATLNTGDTIQTYINKFGESTIFATFETGTRVWIIRVYNLYSTTYDISLFCPATLERYTQTVSGTSTTIYSVIASANQDNVSTLHLYKHQIDLGASSPSVIIELISADKTKYDNNSNATSLLPLYCDANSPYKATLRIGTSYYYLLGAEVTGSSTMFSGYTITFYYQSSTTNTIQTYSFTLGTISDTVTEV